MAYGRITVFVSAELLEEFLDVLQRPHVVKLLAATPATYLRLLKDASIWEAIRQPFTGSPDPDDDYLVALSIQEKAWLVTGDGPLLRWETPPRGLKRMTYADFRRRVL